MSVTTTATDVIYTEDGSTLVFPFTTFSVFKTTDLVVTSIVIATGVQTVLVLNTDYTVTLNANGTGNVTKTVALSSANQLVIQRVLPVTQLIVLADNEGTDAATFEEGYDRLTMIAQQIQAQINRSILQPITASTPISFPNPVPSTYLGFDASGNMTTLTSVSTVTLAPVSPSVALFLAQVNAGGTNFQYVTLASLLAALTAANLISGKILFQLANIPAGAGVIPIANIPSIPGSQLITLSTVPSGAGLLPLANTPAFPYIKVSNTQTQNTNGGTATSGSWGDCVLNTKDVDTGSIASLGSNHVTLPAGTYKIKGRQQFYRTNSTQIRIFNVSDSSVIANGESTSSGSADNCSLSAEVCSVFTLATSKIISMQYQVSTTGTTTGLGIAANFTSEVYATLEIEKIG